MCVSGPSCVWEARCWAEELPTQKMLHKSINNPPSEHKWHSGTLRATTIQELWCGGLSHPSQSRCSKWSKTPKKQLKQRIRNKLALSYERWLTVSRAGSGRELLPQTVRQEQNLCQRWRRSTSERSARTQTAGTGLRLPADDCTAPHRTCRLWSGPARGDSSPVWSLHAGPGAERDRIRPYMSGYVELKANSDAVNFLCEKW